MRGLLAVLFFGLTTHAYAQQCSVTPGMLPSVYAWKKGSNININIDAAFNNGQKNAIKDAIQNWVTFLSTHTGYDLHISYYPDGTPPVAGVDPNGKPFGGPGDLQFYKTAMPYQGQLGGEVQDGHRYNGYIRINPLVTNNTAMTHVVAHEFGHSTGLDDCKFCPPASSVMTHAMGGVNDTSSGADGPTDCDKVPLKATYPHPYDPIGGGIGGPGNGRPRPNGMPDHCYACKVHAGKSCVQTDQGPVSCEDFEEWGYCCMWFPTLNTNNYSCGNSGWVQTVQRCTTDLCCIHPDDQRGEILAAGTTCGEQGWYEHNQATECQTAAGTACVKKEICGGGLCMPYPNYCWKAPYVPTPQPTPTPAPGKTCSQMGWYPADGADACAAAHGSCERKQDCDGGQCQPWPHYCYRPTGGGSNPANPTPTPGPEPTPTPPGNKTCGDMGWYDGNAGDQCQADAGAACIKKQDCDGPCPPPGYCWKTP